MDDWKCWRDAGELYGRVKKGLGFGDLAMYEQLESTDGFRLQWWFSAEDKRYSGAYPVTCSELLLCQSIEGLADEIVRKLKHDARAATNRRREGE